MKSRLYPFALLLLVPALAACNDGKAAATSAPSAASSGGAVKSAEAAGDPAARGKELFASKTCAACHQMDARVVGPPLRGVVAKRGEDWVFKMIQNPDKMVKEDPAAKALFEEYKTPMPSMKLADDDVHAIIAYLKSEG